MSNHSDLTTYPFPFLSPFFFFLFIRYFKLCNLLVDSGVLNADEEVSPQCRGNYGVLPLGFLSQGDFLLLWVEQRAKF